MSKFKIFHTKNNLSYKQVKFRRNALSFILFLFIVFASISISGGVGMSNQSELANSLLKSSYINALTTDVRQYASDLFDEAGLPKKSVEEGISYGEIYELERSYIYSTLIESDEYNDNAFLANVLHIKDNITSSLKKSLQDNDIVIDDVMEENIDKITTDISNYAKQRVRFENEELYVKILYGSKIANQIILVVSLVSCVLIIAKLLTIGNKKYRSLRYAIYSFSGAAIFNLSNILILNIHSSANDGAIHPSYLQGAINSYIDACTYDFLMVSLFVLFIAVCVAAVSWIMKRRNI